MHVENDALQVSQATWFLLQCGEKRRERGKRGVGKGKEGFRDGEKRGIGKEERGEKGKRKEGCRERGERVVGKEQRGE